MQSSPSSQQRLASTSRPSKLPAPQPDLVFVSVSHPDEIKDRTTNRKIRRHVMKEIGLSRRKNPLKGRMAMSRPSDDPTPSGSESSTAVMVPRPDRPLQHTFNPHSQQIPGLGLPKQSSRGFGFPFADSALFSRLVSARARRIAAYCMKTDILELSFY